MTLRLTHLEERSSLRIAPKLVRPLGREATLSRRRCPPGSDASRSNMKVTQLFPSISCCSRLPDLLVALTSQGLTSIMQVEYEDTMSMPPPPNGMQVLSHQGFEASDDEEEEEEVQDGGGESASLSSRPV